MLTPYDVSHHVMIHDADRKGLFKQIRSLVRNAQQIAADEMDQRRKLLHRKLEQEDEIFQQEFANKIKSRIDKNIKKRKEVLLKIKEERNQLDHEFLEQKKIQRQLEDCYEVREALNRKECLEVRNTQLEQITENQRAIVRNRQLDEYWCKIRDARIQDYDQKLAFENKLRRDMQSKIRTTLDEQVAMHKQELEVERELRQQEAKEIRRIRSQIELEERQGTPPKSVAYCKELLDIIAAKKAQREAEESAQAEEHRALMRQVAKEEIEESAALWQRKRAVYHATMEYIKYAREMHKLEEEAQEMRNARIDDLRRLDLCTNDNMKRELTRRAEMAALYYAELRRQLCEEYERRLREKQELREHKIIENRFARPDKANSEIAAERRKVREELERQVSENERLRAAEEAKYNRELQQVSADRNFCKHLAEQYILEQRDFLPVHPNWRIYACPKKEYVGMPAAKEANYESKEADAEETCVKPCGCNARTDYDCTQHSYLSQLKRGLNAESKLHAMKECQCRG